MFEWVEEEPRKKHKKKWLGRKKSRTVKVKMLASWKESYDKSR